MYFITQKLLPHLFFNNVAHYVASEILLPRVTLSGPANLLSI